MNNKKNREYIRPQIRIELNSREIYKYEMKNMLYKYELF